MTRQSFFYTVLWITLIAAPLHTSALQFALPSTEKNIFGKIQFAIIHPQESLFSIARQYDVGYYELLEANPHVSPDHPEPGTVLLIPTQYLLPPVPRVGIVINVATMRLYYFPKGRNYFYTYPVGIGKTDWETPLGALHVIQKVENPTWIIPRSIVKYRLAQGETISQTAVPAGPDNPLGAYAIRLSIPTYLIHGTNNPESVGRRSSAGCIHLYPEDIKTLFSQVPVHTQVLIINQPVLLGWKDKILYMEAHLPLAEQRDEFTRMTAVILDLLHNFLGDEFTQTNIEWPHIYSTTKDHLGVPQAIGNRAVE